MHYGQNKNAVRIMDWHGALNDEVAAADVRITVFVKKAAQMIEIVDFLETHLEKSPT